MITVINFEDKIKGVNLANVTSVTTLESGETRIHFINGKFIDVKAPVNEVIGQMNMTIKPLVPNKA